MNDNSTWKKCKVHALPTKESDLTRILEYNSYQYCPGQIIKAEPGVHAFQPIHLYITSDEEIKEGDWCLRGLEIFQVATGYWEASVYKKIIASTDPKLINQSDWKGMYKSDECVIAQPSQDFIKKFCEVGGIDEVMVEYTYTCDVKRGDCDCSERDLDCQCKSLKPKVSSDNTITIRKVKDSWSREEVIDLLRNYASFLGQREGQTLPTIAPLDKWIEENL